MEELQQFEVMYPIDHQDQDHHHHHDNNNYLDLHVLTGHHDMLCSSNNKLKKQKANLSPNQSVPVDIPIRGNMLLKDWDVVEISDDDDEEMIPPHVIVRRRMIAGKMAFSVRTGIGRTLKGRDLREVRDSILRLTGFLE